MWYEEIAEIRRLAGLTPLEEAAPSPKRLLPMFDAILAMAPQLKGEVEREVEWARQTLEREDRVIWYLRYLQMALLVKMTEADSTIGERVEKKIRQFAAKAGMTEGNVKSSLSMFMDGSVKRFLTHFLSMPISGIQQYAFAWQTPSEIYDAFNEMESDWREDQDRTVPHDQNADVVIDFGDGYAWYNLNKAYCPAEAKAMGHCGNSPRQHSSDTILSLRRSQQVGDEEILTPVLTFILDDNGMLGEMKGRGNDKPAERYHKYIIPLLRHEAITGIKGGGYMPENNFNINDLDDEIKDELIAEKPGLEGPTAVVERLMDSGDYDRGISAIEDLMREHGLSYQTLDVERDGDRTWRYWHANLDKWDSFEDVANEFDDKPVESLYSALEQVDDMKFDEESYEKSLTPELVLEILEKMPKPQQDAVIRGTNQTYSDSIDRADALENAASIILREGTGNRFYHYLINSINDAIEDSTDLTKESIAKMKEKVIDRIEEYADAGYPMRPYHFYTGPQDSKNWQGPWATIVSLGDIMDMISSGIEGDGEYGGDEYYYDYLSWNQDGIVVDYDNLSEDRREYGNHPNLTPWDEVDPLAEEIEGQIFDLELENLTNGVAYHMAQWINIRESEETKGVSEILEESFDQDFDEILRRAGIRA